MLPNWNERPQIVANLTNPAFCGKIIHAFIKGYNSGSCLFPYPLSFFILPLILQRKTRELIPTHSRKSLHTWFEEHPNVKIDLISRIKSLKPFTKESIIFLLAHNKIEISSDGLISCKLLKNTFPIEEEVEEVLECFKKAEILGKIFSKSGTQMTIYSLIGVKP